MATMYDRDGNRVEINYDREHNQTHWETYDRDGNPSGGGQRGGNEVDTVKDDYERAGYREKGGSN